MSRFQDLFSQQASSYARYRPKYPAELFEWLAQQVPGHGLVWDCATGNGQAAVALAERFDRVVATDGSAAQLEQAQAAPGVTYRVAHADESGLADASVDLVTVATAVHWFDLPPFYREARRVLRPGGVLAVWAYFHCTCGDASLDELLMHYGREVVGPYFAPGMEYVIERYRTLPFPFEERTPPPFEVVIDWDLRGLLGFLYSWSATQRYAAATGRNPLDELLPQLSAAWGDVEQPRRWRFPMMMRVGS